MTMSPAPAMNSLTPRPAGNSRGGTGAAAGGQAANGPGAAAGRALINAVATRARFVPGPGRIARRRIAVTLSKWLLPAVALALLSAMVVWPELERAGEHARTFIRQATSDLEGGRMIGPRYHGLDEQGRPFVVTADTARQIDPDRVALVAPAGDITLQDRTWLMLRAKRGVFFRKTNQIDLSSEVFLYRDDGITMTTESASIDMKNGAVGGPEKVHAEGPFGTLDA